MNTPLCSLVAIATCIMSTGCSQVTSSVAGVNSVKGEAWYVRSVGLPFLTFSTTVYYCPTPQERGPVTCKEAIMHTDSGLVGHAGEGLTTGSGAKGESKASEGSEGDAKGSEDFQEPAEETKGRSKKK